MSSILNNTKLPSEASKLETKSLVLRNFFYYASYTFWHSQRTAYILLYDQTVTRWEDYMYSLYYTAITFRINVSSIKTEFVAINKKEQSSIHKKLFKCIDSKPDTLVFWCGYVFLIRKSIGPEFCLFWRLF